MLGTQDVEAQLRCDEGGNYLLAVHTPYRLLQQFPVQGCRKISLLRIEPTSRQPATAASQPASQPASQLAARQPAWLLAALT